MRRRRTYVYLRALQITELGSATFLLGEKKRESDGAGLAMQDARVLPRRFHALIAKKTTSECRRAMPFGHRFWTQTYQRQGHYRSIGKLTVRETQHKCMHSSRNKTHEATDGKVK